MPAPERRALLVTTRAAAPARTNGASLRADEVVSLLESSGYHVVRTEPALLPQVTGNFDVGVAVSYVCAPSLRALRARAPRIWLDAVDSWLLVNGSGLRSGRPAYLLRALRDGARLAVMPPPDLVTYISGADLRVDRDTVRAGVRLVLPSSTPTPAIGGYTGTSRRVVLAGDWGYTPNRDGLRWFRREVLPALESRMPGPQWSVAVYGGGAPPCASERLHCLGYADNPAVLYGDGDVHAAPIRFGAGVKRKVVQPLLAGLPVVTTAAGAHGLRPCSLLDVCATAEGFASALAHRLSEAPGARRPVGAASLVDQDDSAAVAEWLRS